MDLTMAVSRLPNPGETLVDGMFYTAPGGKGANQAVAAARAGATVEWRGCVGNDLWGSQILHELRAAGVDVSRARIAEGVSTSVAMIFAGGGDNSIAVDLGANRLLEPADVGASWDADALLIQLEIELEVNLAAIESAAAQGIPVILNPAPARDLGRLDPSHIAWITPNELEAEQLTGESIPEAAAAALHAQGYAGVVITLGARGALLSMLGHDPLRIPAPTVDCVVDTVGAGDTFNGYFCCGCTDGLDPVAAAKRAVQAASLSVQRAGAIPSIPTRFELGTC